MNRSARTTPVLSFLAAAAFALAALGWAGAASASEGVPMVVPAELAKRLKSESAPVVLDVRTEPEWNAGHIPGALHVPVDQVKARLAEIPRDRDVVVHCAVGPRARSAEAMLVAAGYDRVVHLEGGFNAWSAAGLPVEK